jgi:hypothetical protein
MQAGNGSAFCADRLRAYGHTDPVPVETQLSWLAASTISWFIGGAVGLVSTTFGVYRAVTRLRGWGPSDT